MKALLAGVEMRFLAENAALEEAINAHVLATKAQMSHLEAQCKEA